ncbi:hypothetical protein GQ42DRAFT_157366 [Ramicandelaber brevisporus]|nr:hypothetical protein GQ42DRAFT_157366 [Ramicandelaber brevisporus]
MREWISHVRGGHRVSIRGEDGEPGDMDARGVVVVAAVVETGRRSVLSQGKHSLLQDFFEMQTDWSSARIEDVLERVAPGPAALVALQQLYGAAAASADLVDRLDTELPPVLINWYASSRQADTPQFDQCREAAADLLQLLAARGSARAVSVTMLGELSTAMAALDELASKSDDDEDASVTVDIAHNALMQKATWVVLALSECHPRLEGKAVLSIDDAAELIHSVIEQHLASVDVSERTTSGSEQQQQQQQPWTSMSFGKAVLRYIDAIPVTESKAVTVLAATVCVRWMSTLPSNFADIDLIAHHPRYAPIQRPGTVAASSTTQLNLTGINLQVIQRHLSGRHDGFTKDETKLIYAARAVFASNGTIEDLQNAPVYSHYLLEICASSAAPNEHQRRSMADKAIVLLARWSRSWRAHLPRPDVPIDDIPSISELMTSVLSFAVTCSDSRLRLASNVLVSQVLQVASPDARAHLLCNIYESAPVDEIKSAIVALFKDNLIAVARQADAGQVRRIVDMAVKMCAVGAESYKNSESIFEGLLLQKASLVAAMCAVLPKTLLLEMEIGERIESGFIQPAVSKVIHAHQFSFSSEAISFAVYSFGCGQSAGRLLQDFFEMQTDWSSARIEDVLERVTPGPAALVALQQLYEAAAASADLVDRLDTELPPVLITWYASSQRADTPQFDQCREAAADLIQLLSARGSARAVSVTMLGELSTAMAALDELASRSDNDEDAGDTVGATHNDLMQKATWAVLALSECHPRLEGKAVLSIDDAAELIRSVIEQHLASVDVSERTAINEKKQPWTSMSFGKAVLRYIGSQKARRLQCLLPQSL